MISEKKENSMRIKVAYTSLILGIIVAIISLIDHVYIKTLIENQQLERFLSASVVGLVLIYHKLHTTPITEALSNWWEKRNKKSEEQKVENSEIKTYQDYKNHESKK